MKLLFIDLLKYISDQQGVYSITAFLRKNGVDVNFFAGTHAGRLIDKILKYKPDILLYSSFTNTLGLYIKFDALIKRRYPVFSIIGGPGPTFDWKCIEHSTIDAACVGEGEKVLLEFLRNNNRPVNNIFMRGESGPRSLADFVDLDTLPIPDRSQVYAENPILKDMPSKQFISGRGCPFNCTYCFNHQFRAMFKGCGPYVRKKSVDYLMEEINQVKRLYGLKNVVFSDDTFIINKPWFIEFCARFPKEVGLTYNCSVRANLVDEDIACMLRESGCSGVMWSIETGDTTLRNNILKRAISDEQIETTAHWLNKYKIPCRIGNMIGLPGERIEQMLQTIELNIRAKPTIAYATIFLPFPGLSLTRYAVENGYYHPGIPLPENCLTESPLKYNAEEKDVIRRLLCCFPFFVRFPVLFHSLWLRRICLATPFRLMKFVFDIYFGYVLSRIYMAKASLWFKIRMATRFLRD